MQMPMPMIYNPSNWYWIIAGDTANVWSSAVAGFVPSSDPAYAEWLAATGVTPALDTIEELYTILAEQYPAGSLQTYCVYKRWLKEQGGMTLSSGMPIETDDRAQAKVNGVVLAATADPNFTTQWHAADGSYWPVDATAVTAMSSELQAHINNCFSVSSQTMAGITDGSITTLAEIDAAFDAISKEPRKSKKK